MKLETEQRQTQDLLADLAQARDEITALMDDYGAAFPTYQQVTGDLMLMRDKIAFLSNVMRQTMDVTLPNTADTEETAVALLMTEASNWGIVKNFLWLSTAPMALSITANLIARTKWVKAGGKFTRMAKWSNGLKIVRFAKFAGPVALAMEIGLWAYSEGQAKLVNADLRESIKEMRVSKDKAKAELAELKEQTRKAKADKAAMLKEAGVATVDEYVVKLKEAFVDAGALQETFNITRRMLNKGMDPSLVVELVEKADETLVARIAKRLEAEKQFVDGGSIEAVAASLDLEPEQAAEIGALVDARDAYVRGKTQLEIAELTGISNGSYIGIEETLDRAMSENWTTIESGDNFDILVQETLTRADAYADLNTELRAKTDLSAGQDVGALATKFGIDRAEVVLWASQLPLQQEEARKLRADGARTVQDIASETRLPQAMVTTV